MNTPVRANARTTPDLINQCRPFVANTMSGVAGPVHDTGALPIGWHDRYADARERQEITYTVLSYWTPIAWRLTSGEWVVPGVKYSPTTSKHQTYAKRGIAA
jgi:hypothetical protein